MTNVEIRMTNSEARTMKTGFRHSGFVIDSSFAAFRFEQGRHSSFAASVVPQLHADLAELRADFVQ
jgi:hypothetical protein